MNPTDQARKEARKRELKKNKKQRQMVRAAVLKGKDPQQLIADLQRIDEMEYNVSNPPPLSEKVLRDKRKKLRETWDRVLRLYQKEDPEHFSELKKMELDYEGKRNTLIKYYESVKFAQQVEVDQIPLPSAPSAPHVVPSLIPLPVDLPVSILKAPVMDASNAKAPGVPPGPPPDLSDDEEMEENEPPPTKAEKAAEEKANKAAKTRKIRFADEGPDRPPGVDDEADVTEFLKEVEKSHREAVPPPMPMMFRHPPPSLPPPPSMPPPSLPPPSMPPPPRLGLVLPPGPPPGLPPRPLALPRTAPPVLSAPPSLIPRPAPGEEKQRTTIEAKPQLRNLSADVTRFMPTSLRVKRDPTRKPNKDVPVVPTVSAVTAPTKDDAYEVFMKEMENLL